MLVELGRGAILELVQTGAIYFHPPPIVRDEQPHSTQPGRLHLDALNIHIPKTTGNAGKGSLFNGVAEEYGAVHQDVKREPSSCRSKNTDPRERPVSCAFYSPT